MKTKIFENPEERRLFINKKERIRTECMSNNFKKLASKIKVNVKLTKQNTLDYSIKYIKFLDQMLKDEDFRKRFNLFDIKVAFQIYLLEINDQDNDSNGTFELKQEKTNQFYELPKIKQEFSY